MYEYLLMTLFYSETKKRKYFLDPPKKAQTYERSQYSYMHMCLFIAAACDLNFYLVDIEWFDTKQLQSNPFIENYYLIIVVFSLLHFSIYDNLCTKENTRFNARTTHFKWCYIHTFDSKFFYPVKVFEVRSLEDLTDEWLRSKLLAR